MDNPKTATDIDFTNDDPELEKKFQDARTHMEALWPLLYGMRDVPTALETRFKPLVKACGVYMNHTGLRTREQTLEHMGDEETREQFKTFISAFVTMWNEATATDASNESAREGLLFEDVIEKLFPAKEKPVTIKTAFPRNFVEPLDKISWLAFEREWAGGREELRMESRKSPTKITTVVEAIFDAQFNGAQKFTRFDGEIYCAVCTLKEAGNSFATPRMIYQAISGHKDAVPTQTQAGSIEESINKFIYTRIIINAEAEGKMRGIDAFVYDGPMLHANWEPGPVSLNGQIIGEGGRPVKCLRILEQPVLYEYASRKNQIGRVSIEILNTPIRKTEETIVLQAYLRNRIHAMRGGNSNIIRYDAIYKEVSKVSAAAGETDNPANVSAVELSKRRAAIRGHVKKILDAWQATGFIKAYSETSKGRTIYSVTISKQATDQPLSQKKRQPARA